MRLAISTRIRVLINRHSFFLVLLLSLISAATSIAQTITSAQSGNWSSTTTWVGGVVPGAANTVVIGAGHNVTVDSDRSCSSVSVGNGSTLTVSSSVTLTVSGAISFPNLANANSTGALAGAGSIIAGSMSIGGTVGPTGSATVLITSTISSVNLSGNLTITSQRSGNNNNNPTFAIASGNATVNGQLSCVTANNGASTTLVTMGTGAQTGTLALANSIPITTSGNGGNSSFNFNGTNSTVNYSGPAQTVLPVAYRNLTLSGSGAKIMTGITTVNGNLTLSGTATATTGANLTIGGNLSIGNGTTFTIGAFNLTVTGTTTVGGGSSGSLNFSSATGTKIFNGLTAISSGGTWSNGANNSPVTFRGGLTNSGTFNAGTGVHTFDANAQQLNGTLTITNVTVTGITLTNNNNLNVTSALSGTGGLTQAASATLSVGGTSGITSLTASANPNTVQYNGAAVQSVKQVTYHNLVLAGAGNKTFTGNNTINGNLSINGSAVAILANGTNSTANSLTLGGAGAANGSWGGTASAATNRSITYFGLATTGTINITSNTCDSPPVISSHPSVTDTDYCEGTSATALSVTASAGTGTIANYQWYSNTVASNSGGSLVASGATLSSYTPSTAVQGTLYYYCVVTNSNGCTTTSNVSGAITILASPTISAHPATTGEELCAGETATTLSIAANGNGGTISGHQWYSNTVASNSGGTLLSGETSTDFTPPTATPGTLYYYCVVSNDNGCSTASNVSGAVVIREPLDLGDLLVSVPDICTNTSALVTLTSASLYVGSYTITYDLSGPNSVTGATATMTSVAAGSGTFSTSSLVNAGSNTLTVTQIESTVCGNQSANVSSNAFLTRTGPDTPGVITGTTPQCEGSSGQVYSIDPVVGIGTITYNWTVPSGSITAGQGTTSITVTFGATGGNITVRASDVCGLSAESTFAVTINALPTLFDVTFDVTGGSLTKCEGAGGGITVGLSGSQSGVSYQLLLNGSDLGAPVAGTGSPLSFGLQSAEGVYTVHASNGSTSCAATMNGQAAVIVNYVSGGGGFTSLFTICPGGTIFPTEPNPAASGSGTLTYQWQVSDNAVGGFADIKAKAVGDPDNWYYDIGAPFTSTKALYKTQPLYDTYFFRRIASSTLNGVTCTAAPGNAIEARVSSVSTWRTRESGDWHINPSVVWGTPQVPQPDNGNLGCPVTVLHPLTLTTSNDISIVRGVYSITEDVTDSDATFNWANLNRTGNEPRQGVLDIVSGTVNFQGGINMQRGSLIVRSGATLILGPLACECECLNWNGGTSTSCYDPSISAACRNTNRLIMGNLSVLIIEQGAKVYVYGSVDNKSNTGDNTVNGFLYITGNYASSTGNVQVDQDFPGIGDIYTCGSMTSTGGSTIFGSPIDCIANGTIEPPCQASALLCSHRVNVTPPGSVGWCVGTVLTAEIINSTLPGLFWQSSADPTNPATPWTTEPTFNDNLVYSWSTDPTVSRYYRTGVTKGPGAGCTAYSNTVLVVPGLNRWKGADIPPPAQPVGRTNDWHYPNNWCLNVPDVDNLEDVIINAGTPTIYDIAGIEYSPDVPAKTARVQSLVINPGAQIILADATSHLDIFGNVDNFGVIDASGTVVFKASSVVEGSPASTFRFGNLTVEPGNTVTLPTAPVDVFIEGDFDLTGAVLDQSSVTLHFSGGLDQEIRASGNDFLDIVINKTGGGVDLEGGTLNLFGNLSIESPTVVSSNGNLFIRSTGSSTTGDGRIGPVPTDINGDALGTVTGNVRVERYMGSVMYAPFRYIGSPVNNGSIPSIVDKLYRYDQTSGWIRHTGPMPIGAGYTALTYDQSAVTWSVTNTIKTGKHTWTFDKTGWHLVGNPYPSAIQWNGPLSGGWVIDEANVASVIGITDNNVSGYPSYFRYRDYRDPNPSWGVGEIAGPGEIAMGQSFWVYANAGGTLTIKEQAKSLLGGQFYRTTSSKTERLEINVTNGAIGDQAYLVIHPEASETFNFNMDFPKFWNMSMNTYLRDNADESMLMLALSEIGEDAKIPLGIQFTEPGEYRISFSHTDNFTYSERLYLVDKYENMVVPVTSEEVYTFSVSDISKPVNDRFYLAMSPETEWNIESSIDIYPNPVKDELNIRLYGIKAKSEASLFDVSGRVVQSGEFTEEATLDMLDLPAGMYILKLKTIQGIVTRKIVKHD